MSRCKELLLVFLLMFNIVFGYNFQNIPTDDLLDILIPTTKSDNLICRNDSIFYMKELKRLKLWASEMFDASSKIPSGILFGSTINFGNFDECLEVIVPERQNIVGKYCLAKFHVTPPVNSKNYGDFANNTLWDKIHILSKDRSRSSRSDFHLSYCIPSSCSHKDLELSLKKVTEKLNFLNEFQVSTRVSERSCQVTNEFTLGSSDFLFIGVVLTFFVLAMGAACYDWLMHLPEMQKYKLQGTKHKLVMCFSGWTNLKRLNKDSNGDDRLQCLHGIRVISMFLIIMGHRIMFQIGSPIVNPNFVEQFYKRIETTALLNGPIIVDTFFNISGFLCCYLLLKEMNRRKGTVNFFILYLHRFIRLTPSYLVVLAFYCTLFTKIGSGPFWKERVQVEQERCVANWWTNVLYLNNYINKDQLCMFQSWYLTCDMHFFLIAPLLVLLLRKKPIIGLASLLTLIMLSISIVFAIVYMNKEDGILLLYMKFLRDPVINNTFQNIYIPTHMRASPYFVGMVAGYIKYKMRMNTWKIPKMVVYTGWILFVIVIEGTVYWAFIFYIPNRPYDPFMSALYAALHHFTWSICISWMIIAVSEGYGNWIEVFLTWKPLAVFNKITYSAFLCHGAIQIYTSASLRHATYSSIFNLVYCTAADIILAYIVGLLLNIVFESPIVALEKILLKKPEHTKSVPINNKIRKIEES